MTVPPRTLPRLWYRVPLLGAVGYVGLSALWVAGGDWFMARWVPSVGTWSWMNTGKGMLFVLLCAALVYALLHRLRNLTERHLTLLHASEATFRRMFERHPEPMWVFSVDTLGFLEVNRAALDLYGYSRAQMLSMSIRDLRDPSQQGALDQAVERARRDPGSLFVGRVVHRDAGGRPIKVRVRSRDIDFQGRAARLVEVTPIEDLLHLEQERDQLREQVEALRQVGHVALWRMDPVTGEVEGSAAVEAHLGLRPGSFPRRREGFASWVGDAWRQAMLLGLERALAGLDELDIECRIEQDDRYLRLHAVLAEDGQDGYPLLHGTVGDVTELKRQEDAMRRRAERFAAVVDALPDAVLIVDPAGQVRYANDAALRLWRVLPGAALVGSRLEQLTRTDGLRDGPEGSLRVCHLPDGSDINVPCAEFAIEQDVESFSVLVFRGDRDSADIGEALRTANVRLRKLSQRLVGMQESERRKLARDLHDEVGQALAALSMHIDLMDRKEADAGRRERIARLREIVAAALQQVRGMLSALRPPQLDELGLGAALSAQLERLAGHEALRFELDCPPLVPRPSPEIESVAFRLAQECLTNVVKHASASLVKVSLRSLGSSGELDIEVVDDGCGFDSGEGGDAGGRLGLLSMRERVALVGGQLSVESVRGLGTRIRARLPLSTPEEVMGDE